MTCPQTELGTWLAPASDVVLTSPDERSMRLRLPCVALVVALGCGSTPSDQDLVAEFHRHRADYDTLVAMLRADSGLGRVAYDFTRPANFFSGAPLPASTSVTPARLASYRRLFDRLSL